MTRFLLAASLLLFPALPLPADFSSAELEESAEIARRAAGAALRGQPRLLFEALDIDAIVRSRIGPHVWERLTERQRQPLRSVVRRTFGAALVPPHPSSSGIAWSSVKEEAGQAAVFLGIRTGDRWMKTRWTLRRADPMGWRIQDILLSDPGISLADRARAALGPNPVLPHERRSQAQQEAWPRLAILAAIALVVLVARRHIAKEKRLLLYLTAAAPALLFAIDGVLAVRRALAEPYAVAESFPPAPSDRWLRLAREAEREGAAADAGPFWERALSAGAPPAEVAYERGLAARERGDTAIARRELEAALSDRPAAPGAARELALLDLGEGKNSEARSMLEAYLAATGPDPDALGLLAAVETNLGSAPEAIEVLRQAREMVGGGAPGAQLEARVRARTGDGPGTVAALRALEREGGFPDREALRADPVFLPIANDPAWVAFLDELPPPARPTPAS